MRNIIYQFQVAIVKQNAAKWPYRFENKVGYGQKNIDQEIWNQKGFNSRGYFADMIHTSTTAEMMPNKVASAQSKFKANISDKVA